MRDASDAGSAAVRAVVFDLGGVLVEFAGIAAITGWFSDPPEPDRIWERWLASPAVRAFEAGRSAAESFADELILELGLPVGRDEFLRSFREWPRRALPGARELLLRLPPGCIRATLSNTNAVHWPRFTDEMGLADLFDRHFPSHRLGLLKPDREVFAHVVDALGCDPGTVLFLDDQGANVAAARAVGLRAARVQGVEEAQRALEEVGLLHGGRRLGPRA